MNDLTVAINSGVIDSGLTSGVGYRTLKIIEELDQFNFDLHVIGEIPPDIVEERSFQYHAYGGRSPLHKLYETHFGTGVESTRVQADILHCPKSILPFYGHSIQTITIHDLIFLKYPEKYSFAWKMYWTNFLQASIRKSDYIVTVSQNTKVDLIDFYSINPEQIRVIPGGINLSKFSPTRRESDTAIYGRYELPQRYLLFLGHFFARKNLSRLLEAYAPIARENNAPPLVLAGPNTEGAGEIQSKVAELSIEDYVFIPGYIAQSDLSSLYRNAEALVYPSLEEGFGFPVLEALACGCPVICSDISTLREIGGDHASYFDPFSVEAIRESILKLLDGTHERTRPSRIEQYSWSNVGRMYMDFFREIV